MLPAEHRLTDPSGFRRAGRRGLRAGSRTLIAHHLVLSGHGDAPAQVGFVVSKAVGNAVTRNRVKRRLRHAVRSRLDVLPAASLLVVLAKPAAAAASYDELLRDLDHCLAGAGR